MIDQLEAAFNYHQQALGLRQERHKVLASNIANADTPNYKARDFDFASELKKAVEHGGAPPGAAWPWRALPIVTLPGRPFRRRGVTCSIGFPPSPASMAIPSTWIASAPPSPTMPCATRPR